MKKNYQAFGVLSICALFLFYKYVSQLFPSLVSDALIEQFQLNGIQIGILASSYYYSYSLMQVFAGVMLDKYSIKIFACLAILITSVAIWEFANTNHFLLMCIARAFMGAGCAFATTLYLKCAATYTSDKTFGLVSSLLATATMLGAAVGSAPIALLFEKTGWRYGLVYIAYAGIFLSILSFVFISVDKKQLKPCDVSMDRIKQIVFNYSNIKLLFYSGITFSPIIVMGGLWGIPFLELKFHVTTSTAAILISTMFVGHAIGSPIWALINARTNNRNSLMHIANVISFLCISIILFIPVTFGEAQVLFFLWGGAVGCFMLSFQICRELNGIAVMGMAVAFINSGEGLIGIILEPGIGFILDLIKTAGATEFSLANYQLSLSIVPLCYIISSVFVYGLPLNKTKRSGSVNTAIENMA